jgi:glutamine amidotransferase
MDERIPILGLCVGAQAFLESSEEAPNVDGLGWVSGTNIALEVDDSKHFPRIGWDFISQNKEASRSNSVFGNVIKPHDPFYFAHSYKFNLRNSELIAGFCHTNSRVVAIFIDRNIIGAQFHPEKSLDSGKKFLATFAGWNPNAS